MKTKRYFSKIAGSKFIMPDGFEVVFAHGFYDFDPEKFAGETLNIPTMNNQTHASNGKPKAEVYFQELESLVKNNNPLVYDPEHMGGVAEVLPAVLDPTKNAHSESGIHAQEAALARVGKTRVTGDDNVGGNGQPTDVNSSTVDPALQRQVFKPVGPGAAAAAAAAAKVRAHQQAATVQATAKNNVAQ